MHVLWRKALQGATACPFGFQRRDPHGLAALSEASAVGLSGSREVRAQLNH